MIDSFSTALADFYNFVNIPPTLAVAIFFICFIVLPLIFSMYVIDGDKISKIVKASVSIGSLMWFSFGMGLTTFVFPTKCGYDICVTDDVDYKPGVWNKASPGSRYIGFDDEVTHHVSTGYVYFGKFISQPPWSSTYDLKYQRESERKTKALISHFAAFYENGRADEIPKWFSLKKLEPKKLPNPTVPAW